MVLRIKNQWFNESRPKTPSEHASAMAFITWRVTQNMIRQMRQARFDIDVGPPYFAFMREVLAFLAQVLDRMAYERLPPAQRAEFTTALVVRLAEILEESELEWLGDPAAGQPSWRERFIDQYNELADAYADFGHGPEGPDFAFVRYLGSRLEAVLPEKDRPWVKDQVMACEVPEALQLIRRGFDGLLSPTPRPKRRAVLSGE